MNGCDPDRKVEKPPLEPAPDDLRFVDEGRPPFCRVSVWAFLIALIMIMPCLGGVVVKLAGSHETWIPVALVGCGIGVLAALLGVVGIVRTRGRRRRGRGFAIAAIPLGLIAAVSELAFGVGAYSITSARIFGAESVTILGTPRREMVANVADWYETRPSESFKSQVTVDEFRDWLNGILDEHGQLQKANPNKSRGSTGRGMSFRYDGQFVNGATQVELVVGSDRGESGFKVVDIRVGKSSPLE